MVSVDTDEIVNMLVANTPKHVSVEDLGFIEDRLAERYSLLLTDELEIAVVCSANLGFSITEKPQMKGQPAVVGP